jgi:hypothetical protein
MAASDRLVTTLQEDLSLLFTDLRKFRRTLSRDERNNFDDVWGLSFMMDEGISTTRNYYNQIKSFYNTVIMKRRRPELVLLDELEFVRDAVTSEVVMFESSQLNETQKSQRLLFLFVRDLLDGANGQILDAKNRRDSTVRKMVTVDTKILVSLVVSFTLLGMLFYVYLFALRQTQERQQAWFQSFLVWVVFEILLVSTGMVFLTHIIVPSVIVSDVKRVKQNIVNDILSFKNSVGCQANTSISTLQQEDSTINKEKFDDIESSPDFNAAKYLFASSRLARMYPDLKQSDIVAKFTTHWPRRSLKSNQKSVTNSYNNKLGFVTQAFSRVLLFSISSVIQLPEPVQDIIFQLISTSGFGYMIVLFVSLWRTSPLLVAVPVIFLVLCGHFITATSKSSSFLPLPKIQPVSGMDGKKSVEPVHDSVSGFMEVDECNRPFRDDDSEDDTSPCVQYADGVVDVVDSVDDEKGLNRLEYLLWGRNVNSNNDDNYISDSDSDDDYEEYYDKRKQEMETYISRSEAWIKGSSAVSLRDCDTVSLSGSMHLPPPSKSSPVAAAITVNSRAGALVNIRRKSSIGASSSMGDEWKNDVDDGLVERILQRPKDDLRCVSRELHNSNDGADETKMLSVHVETRLGEEVKVAEFVAASPSDHLQDFSGSSSDTTEETIVVTTKQSHCRVGSDSKSEHGGGAVKRLNPFNFHESMFDDSDEV